jgi:hypothetical protein
MSASSVNIGSVWSTIPKPVLPTTSPAVNSPITTGTRKRGTDASSGPAMPITASSARVSKPNPDIYCQDPKWQGMSVFSSVR